MDLLITLTNQYVFPFFVFIFLLSIFHQPTKIDRSPVKTHLSTIDQQIIPALSPLEEFYEFVEQDQKLLDRIETLINQENFIVEITVFGNSLGYQFSCSELEQTVTYINNHYVCLPIGCWNKDNLWHF